MRWRPSGATGKMAARQMICQPAMRFHLRKRLPQPLHLITKRQYITRYQHSIDQPGRKPFAGLGLIVCLAGFMWKYLAPDY
jgi:hypothetical protein